MDEIYTGSSESFGEIVDGYIDYGKSILIQRAFPDVRDGLKPGARRILYSSYVSKFTSLKKSATLVGRAMEVHPHGDGSIYLTLAHMTDKNGSYNVPFYKGHGDLGNVYSSNAPAAMRYSEAMLDQDTIRDMFGDFEFIKMIPAEEGEGEEPEVLPASFPVILVNGTSGLGVSVSADIPSFNLGDVLDLTVKYLENGELTVDDIIVPDFPTGGILVRNDEELLKIMLTGKGKLRVRAKVEISGKDIKVLEVPAGKTAENIMNMITKADIKEIDKVLIATGRDSDSRLLITCKTKKVVEYVLMELYRRGILQTNYSSNMLMVNGDKPLLTGVYNVVKEWCKWREGVVKTRYSEYIRSVKKEIETLSYFVRLVNNTEWCDTYVETVLKSNTPKQEAEAYLIEIFEDIPKDVCSWIYDRKLTSFRRVGKYTEKYESLLEVLKEYEYLYEHPETQIIKELKELKSLRKEQTVRKTEITYRDYKFSKAVDAEIPDTSFCVYTLKKDGFLMKTRSVVEDDDVLCSIEADASSILVGFDNFGRVLRVVGSEIPFTPYKGDGTYLPGYFDSSFQEDYRVLFMCLLDGKRHMIVYKDGYVGFFDTSEWVGKKIIKVVSQGVDLHVYDMIVDIIPEDNIGDYLFVADYDYRDRLRVSFAKVDDIPVRSRKSRAKVFQGDNLNICNLHMFTYFDAIKYIGNFEWYVNKMRVLKEEDFLGDPELIEDGRYADWGYDVVE